MLEHFSMILNPIKIGLLFIINYYYNNKLLKKKT